MAITHQHFSGSYGVGSSLQCISGQRVPAAAGVSLALLDEAASGIFCRINSRVAGYCRSWDSAARSETKAASTCWPLRSRLKVSRSSGWAWCGIWGRL